MSTKINIGDLEHKASAATQEWPWEVRVPSRGSVIDGVVVQTEDGRQIAETYDSTPWPDDQCVANAEHIAANSPDVTIALVRHIRELTAELTYAATVCEINSTAMASVKHWRALIERGPQ